MPKKKHPNTGVGKDLSSRRGLTVGVLPKQMICVRNEAAAYRQVLESAVLDVHGEINIVDAHVIDALCGCTMAAGIMRWMMRNRWEEMTVADLRACSKEMRDAKNERAKLIRLLRLERDQEVTMLGVLYDKPDVESTEDDPPPPAGIKVAEPLSEEKTQSAAG